MMLGINDPPGTSVLTPTDCLVATSGRDLTISQGVCCEKSSSGIQQTKTYVTMPLRALYESWAIRIVLTPPYGTAVEMEGDFIQAKRLW